ncbi:MAG TPA: glycoside hydrolase family 130 protein [Ohtaekwangia sp.]|uniref:glycoside hydrolase family 130 protein n=1 Tax=Ohtaekwangia sp. TaxID=2066019 RepID=UPI002F93FBEC
MKRKKKFKDVLWLCMIVMSVVACKQKPVDTPSTAIQRDSSWALLPFVKVDSVNPVLTAGTNTFKCPILKSHVKWDEKDVFNPAAVVRDGKVYLLFRAEDKIGKYAGTSRLGLAVSDDGVHFTKMKEPVFFPDNDSLKQYEWEGGVEDPRIVESADGRYIMTYTAYDGTVARLLVATSSDLIHWVKHGRVLQGRYKNAWSKSGAIVSRVNGEHVVAEKINGKYWMYFGDTNLFMATSDDLIHWMPVREDDSLKSVLKPRKGYFDSRLVESGPYAILTEKGIVLIYNGMNLEAGGEPGLAPGAYCGGQALFDKNDPTKLIDRLEKNFIKPEKPYEITGQVNQVCFLEGLVYFKGKWLLYYGTADSKIAVAIHE